MCVPYITRYLQQGVLDNGEEIAVKKLIHEVPWIYKEEFKNELNNLTRAQHKNIVPLVGYCQDTEQIVVNYEGRRVSASVDHRAVCLEYLQGESLDKHLAGTYDSSLFDI
jgi:serine/threonine protein kinase